MNPVGAEVNVSGNVQGVGYRYFCFNKAKNLKLTGWVCNLPDGTVSVYVEGERVEIEKFIAQLQLGPSSASVGHIDVKWLPYSGKYQSFKITG
jgi:acylphosphatase